MIHRNRWKLISRAIFIWSHKRCFVWSPAIWGCHKKSLLWRFDTWGFTRAHNTASWLPVKTQDLSFGGAVFPFKMLQHKILQSCLLWLFGVSIRATNNGNVTKSIKDRIDPLLSIVSFWHLKDSPDLCTENESAHSCWNTAVVSCWNTAVYHLYFLVKAR